MENNNRDTEARQSPFDPAARDPEFYSSDPYQHGTSDYGRTTEGTNNAQFNSVSGMDQSAERADLIRQLREDSKFSAERETRPDSHGSNQEWDVDPAVIEKNRQDAARQPRNLENGLPSSVEGLPDNPSDEALFRRGGATLLEPDDNPQEGYDPHGSGYNDPASR